MQSSGHPEPVDRFGKVLSYLVAISTIIGIPTGLYGYMSSIHAKKAERTYEYYRDFRSEAFQRDWLLLFNRWNEKASDVQQILATKDFDRLRRLASGLVNQDDQSKTAFARVVGFFDEAYACVDNSLCDQNVAFFLLKTPASEFVSAFGSHIMYIRQEYKSEKYGTGLFKVRSLDKRFSVF
jgi:hypothetical protein